MTRRLLRSTLMAMLPLTAGCSDANRAGDRATSTDLSSADTQCNAMATVSVDTTGLGSGTVLSNPAGLACAPPCSATLTGVSANITATANPGARFAGWKGDCLAAGNGTCSLTLMSDHSATTIFTKLANGSQIYDDVDPSRADFSYVNLLQQWAVTSGVSATPPLFAPDTPITRGQMAVFVIRAKNLSGADPANGFGGGSPDNFAAPSTPYFTDVPPTHVFFKHIQKLKELGITQGCSPTTFCPDDPLPLWQASVFLTRAAFGEAFTSTATPYFSDVPDVPSPNWFRYIQKMRDDGIECGCAPGLYCPSATVTRGWMAELVTRRFFGAPACTPPAGNGGISVTSATYGANYGDVPVGNVTAQLAAACNGQTNCNYTIDYRVLGDPKPGYPKSYVAEWTCGPGGPSKTSSVPPEAGLGSTIDLVCP